MSRKKTYIAGPMTGKPNWNYPAFFQAEDKLRMIGLDPINPAREFDGRTDLPYHIYIGKAVHNVVCLAERMYFLEGWQDSPGSRIEYLCAAARGLPMGFEDPGEEIDPELIKMVEEARAHVYPGGDRNEDYGHPRDDFTRTVEIVQQLGLEVRLNTKGMDGEEQALFMMGVKLSRQMNKDLRDNLVDLAGYVMCRERLREPKEEK